LGIISTVLIKMYFLTQFLLYNEKRWLNKRKHIAKKKFSRE